MDATTMTQLTLFSVLMAYFWTLVLIAFIALSLLRRRRINQLELAYVRRNPPMPYILYRNASDTQEVAIPQTNPEPVTRSSFRHINASQQVAMEIHPDTDAMPQNLQTDTNLHRIFAQIKDSNSRATAEHKIISS
jgi:hypothetical protein